MSFYFKVPPRIRIAGDKVKAKSLIGFAKKQFMWMEWANVQNLKQTVRRLRYPDGTQITLTKRFGLCDIDIFVPPVIVPVEVFGGQEIKSVYFCVLDDGVTQTRWDLSFSGDSVSAEQADTVLNVQTWAKSFTVGEGDDQRTLICTREGDWYRIYKDTVESTAIYESEFAADTVLRKETYFLFSKKDATTFDFELIDTTTATPTETTVKSDISLSLSSASYPAGFAYTVDRLPIHVPGGVNAGVASSSVLEDFIVLFSEPIDFDVSSETVTFSSFMPGENFSGFGDYSYSGTDFGNVAEAEYNYSAEAITTTTVSTSCKLASWNGNGFERLEESIDKDANDDDGNQYGQNNFIEWLEGTTCTDNGTFYDRYGAIERNSANEVFFAAERNILFPIFKDFYHLKSRGAYTDFDATTYLTTRDQYFYKSKGYTGCEEIASDDYAPFSETDHCSDSCTKDAEIRKYDIVEPVAMTRFGNMFYVEDEYTESYWKNEQSGAIDFPLECTAVVWSYVEGGEVKTQYSTASFTDPGFSSVSFSFDAHFNEISTTLSPAEDAVDTQTTTIQKLIASGLTIEGTEILLPSYLDNRSSGKENDVLIAAEVDGTWQVYYQNADYTEQVLAAMGLEDDSTVTGFGLLRQQTEIQPTAAA